MYGLLKKNQPTAFFGSFFIVPKDRHLIFYSAFKINPLNSTEHWLIGQKGLMPLEKGYCSPGVHADAGPLQMRVVLL